MAIFGKCLNYKSGLRILILPPEVPFFWSQRWAFFAKVTVFAFLQQKECSNKKIEENKSGLEFNFPLKSNCASLNFDF